MTVRAYSQLIRLPEIMKALNLFRKESSLKVMNMRARGVTKIWLPVLPMKFIEV